MIVQQDPPVEVGKTSFAPVTSRLGEESVSSDQPPAYHSSMSFSGYQPLNPYRAAEEHAKPRFWKALAVAAIIFTLFHVIVRTIVHLTIVNRGHDDRVSSSIASKSVRPASLNSIVLLAAQKGPGGLARDWPEFNRGEVQECVDRTNWPYIKPLEPTWGDDTDTPLPGMDLPPYTSSVSFTLPANTDLLYFLSRGSLAYGAVRIEAVSGSGDDVPVDVEVRYWTESALERATVCKLEKDDGNAHGVGIFTPRNWRNRGHLDNLRFAVRVQIPVSAKNAPRVVKALETDFSNFRHEIGDTVNQLKFDSLSLLTSNSVIVAEVFSSSFYQCRLVI